MYRSDPDTGPPRGGYEQGPAVRLQPSRSRRSSTSTRLTFTWPTTIRRSRRCGPGATSATVSRPRSRPTTPADGLPVPVRGIGEWGTDGRARGTAEAVTRSARGTAEAVTFQSGAPRRRCPAPRPREVESLPSVGGQVLPSDRRRRRTLSPSARRAPSSLDDPPRPRPRAGTLRQGPAHRAGLDAPRPAGTRPPSSSSWSAARSSAARGSPSPTTPISHRPATTSAASSPGSPGWS